MEEQPTAQTPERPPEPTRLDVTLNLDTGEVWSAELIARLRATLPGFPILDEAGQRIGQVESIYETDGRGLALRVSLDPPLEAVPPDTPREPRQLAWPATVPMHILSYLSEAGLENTVAVHQAIMDGTLTQRLGPDRARELAGYYTRPADKKPEPGDAVVYLAAGPDAVSTKELAQGVASHGRALNSLQSLGLSPYEAARILDIATRHDLAIPTLLELAKGWSAKTLPETFFGEAFHDPGEPRYLRCPTPDGCGHYNAWRVAIDRTGERLILDCNTCGYRISMPLDLSYLQPECTGPLDETGPNALAGEAADLTVDGPGPSRASEAGSNTNELVAGEEEAGPDAGQ